MTYKTSSVVIFLIVAIIIIAIIVAIAPKSVQMIPSREMPAQNATTASTSAQVQINLK